MQLGGGGSKLEWSWGKMLKGMHKEKKSNIGKYRFETLSIYWHPNHHRLRPDFLSNCLDTLYINYVNHVDRKQGIVIGDME